MQQNLISAEEVLGLENITYLVGNIEIIKKMPSVPVRVPFDDVIINFLNAVSKELMNQKEARLYPDVVTLGFWLRKASMLKLKERFEKQDGDFRLGRGIAFHVAPSNVPVNYAYSLVSGLLMGNTNVVRVPSRNFPQIDIINRVFNTVLAEWESMKPYICLVRYERNQKINDLLSSFADVRIVWGGDATIAELRKSSLKPRANEITFADRYSLAVIDSDEYLETENKKKIAEDFYNDTYLTDQNACTSPRVVVWTGERKQEAKKLFWKELYQVVSKKYTYQEIQGVNKLTSSYLLAATVDGVNIGERQDNLIVRVAVPEVSTELMELKDNSGYFMEYECDDIMELRDLCNDAHCQTIGYFGDVKIFTPLLQSGIKGVDRIVPIGKTMDFDLLWDGYDLYERLSRVVCLEVNAK